MQDRIEAGRKEATKRRDACMNKSMKMYYQGKIDAYNEVLDILNYGRPPGRVCSPPGS